MFTITLPLLLFSALHLQIDAQCGTGAIYNQQVNKCLQYYSSAVNYETAESVCSTLNGHMVSVHNSTENTFLTQQAAQFIYENGPVWLGAKSTSASVNNPDNWKWEDGTPFNYQNYKIGQPSSLGTSACMQFFTNDGKWFTASCTDSYPFICASDPLQTTTTTACPRPQEIHRCPDGYVWYSYTNFCYKVVIEWVSWTTALSRCQAEGGDLASIHSYSENEFLRSLCITGIDVSKHISISIGLRVNGGSGCNPDNYVWTDGTSSNDFQNWANGEPNNCESEFYTAMMPDPISGYTDKGYWNNVEDMDNRGYICKIKPNY